MPLRPKPGESVKTSVSIAGELWERAKLRAAVERKHLADVIEEALRAHLERPPRLKGGKKT